MENFGRYQLHEMLGQGGMGVVYRAFDTVLQRVVALKLIVTPGGLNSDLRERFFREARAAGHLSHKNIVTIYDLGEEDGRPYIAMEYLDGEDLQKRLARPEKMSLKHKLDLAIEICQGVETRTPTVSFTATSSRPTFTSRTTAAPRFSTSVSPGS